MALEHTFTINDFTPGLITQADARALPKGAAQVCRNVDLDRSDLRPRAGRALHGRLPHNTAAGFRTLYEFYVAGKPPVEHHFVGVSGERLYWSITAVDIAVWTPTAHYELGAQVLPSAEQTNDFLYVCVVAGDSAESEPAWPTAAGEKLEDGPAAADGTRLTWQCQPNPTAKRWKAGATCVVGQIVRPVTQNGCLYQCKIAGASANTAPVWPTTDLATVTDGGVTWECTHAQAFEEIDPAVTVHPTNPVRIEQYADKLYIVDGANDVLQLDSYGNCIRLTEFPAPKQPPVVNSTSDLMPVDAGDQTVANTAAATFPITQTMAGASPNQQGYYNLTGWHAFPLAQKTLWHAVSGPMQPSGETHLFYAQAVSGNAFQGVTKSLALVIAPNTSHTTVDCNDILLQRQLPNSARHDWSDATCASFSMFVDSGSETPMPASVEFFLGQGDDPLLWQYVPVNIAGKAHLDWGDPLLADLTAIDASNKSAVKWIGFRFAGLQLSPNANHQMRILFSPISINSSQAKFAQGAYWFTYTFTTESEESGEYISDEFDNPYPSISINAAIPLSLSVACARDTGSTATGVNVYARGGTTDTWRKIGSTPLGVDGTASISWAGEYPSPPEFLTEYVGRPPTAATMLTIYRNRMAYVGRLPGDATGARDVVYLSNYGDPARVPSAPTALPVIPSTYGGWVDVAQYGNDITGLAALGPVLVVMRAQGIFVCQGDPGDSTFRVDEIDRRDGCLSPESLLQVEGRLIWQARDKILAFDTQRGVAEISTGIAPTVKGYAHARQAASFALYDPQHRRFLLVYPSATVGVAPNSDALVFELKTGGWTQYTSLPGACGLYAAYAALPGLYLADSYGANGAGKVFRVDETLATDLLNDETEVPVDWQWMSGDLSSPFAGRYLQITGLRAAARTAGAEGSYHLLAGIYPNNDPTRAYTRALAFSRLTAYGTGGYGIAQWTPAPRGEMESVAVSLGRATSDLTAVRALTFTCIPRQLLRGRTAPRG